MNTLLFTLEYPPFKGGVANYYDNLVKHWPDKNQIFVLHNNDGRLINEKSPALKWRPAMKALRQEVLNKKINYVLVGNLLPLGTATWVNSFFHKFKYAVIIHGTDIIYAQKSWRKKILARKILQQANAIICNSSYVAGLVKKLNQNLADKIVVANPGVKDYFGAKKSPDKDLIQDKIILFSVGRLIKRKGVDKVIATLPEVIEKIPNLIYVVAGTGPDEGYLKGLALGQRNVIFLGEISEEEKWGWLEACDIFIQPTREEDGNFDGFGIVYLEANLVGKPVIAGESGGVGDAVENGLNGLLVNPEDREDIKNAIIKLATDKNLRQKLGAQGRARALKDFTWPQQITQIYKSINKRSFNQTGGEYVSQRFL